MNTVIDNRYELIEKIGEGGMATVYKAHCNVLNRFVAIKILKPNFVKDKKFIKGFKNESRAAAQLIHNNIVGIYDVGVTEDGGQFIVMEYVDGRTLSDIIEEQGRLSEETTIDIAMQITSALMCAHSKGIIHRDVKPMNILVNDRGVAKITDFGIAKATSATTTIINDNSITGSAHYFSPEQARGGYVDGKSDVYSMGIVIYEMITGRVPFDGDNPISIAMMHLNKEMLPPSVYNPDMSPELEAIIMKASEKVPVNRFASAEELYNALDNLRMKRMGESGRTFEGFIIPPVTGRSKGFNPGDYYIDENPVTDSRGLPDDLDSIIDVEEGSVINIPGVHSIGNAAGFDGSTAGGEEVAQAAMNSGIPGVEVPMTDAERRKAERRRERVKRSSIIDNPYSAGDRPAAGGIMAGGTEAGIAGASAAGTAGAAAGAAYAASRDSGNIPREATEELKPEEPQETQEIRDDSRDTFVSTSPYGNSMKHTQEEMVQNRQEDAVRKNGGMPEYKPARVKQKKITMPRVLGVIVGIILAAALSMGILWLIDYIMTPDVEMPSVVGMNYMDAKDLLESYELEMEIASWEYSDQFEENEVISQDPAEGEDVKEGSVIKVVVSKGLVENSVPALDGMTLEEAQVLIQQCGYNIGTVTYEPNALPEGTVIGQNPKAGDYVGPGSTIDLICSDGTAKAEIKMVNLVGMTLDEATEALKGVNLMLNNVSEKYSNTAKKGYVIEQSVPANASVMTGSPIDITISMGEAPAETVTNTVPIYLDYTKATSEVFRLKIDMIKDGAMTTIFDDLKYRSDNGEPVSVSGSGTAQLYVYFDGVKVSEGTIDFDSGKYPA